MNSFSMSAILFFCDFLVSQLASTIMNSLVGQRELSLIRKACRVEVPVEMIYSRKNQGQAFTLACASGLEDKEICLEWAMQIMQGKVS